MEFYSEAHRACYEKVQGWLKELFGEIAVHVPDAPVFGIVMGSTATQITVFPWGDDDATISVRAYVVTGAEITPDLMSFLLHENDNMRFGAFGIDGDNDIFFQHTIVGSTADKNELRASIGAVLYTADEYDDRIVSRWGGIRATDRR